MIVQVNLDIDLSQEEITFLQKYFVNCRQRALNSYFFIKGKSDHLSILSLQEKGILVENSIGNNMLTQVGNKVCDLFDRDHKLKKLLE